MFPISPKDKGNVISELNSFNVNAQSLFIGKESIAFSIWIDSNNALFLNQKRKSDKSIVNDFNEELKSYNKNIISDCLNDIPTYEAKVLIVKERFRSILYLKKLNELQKNLVKIVSCLEADHYFEIGEPLEENHITNNIFSNGLLSDIPLKQIKDLTLGVLNPNRVIKVDGSKITFSNFMHFIMRYQSWHSGEFISARKSSELKSGPGFYIPHNTYLYVLKSDNIEQIKASIKKIKKVFVAILDQ